MYAHVSTAGTISFRYDYRLNGRRETLVIGRYGRDGISLSAARERCLDARRMVREGQSPAKARQWEKQKLRDARSFGQFAENWFNEARMAESTKAMRRTIFNRDISPMLCRRLLHEIKLEDVRAVCLKVKDRGAPATAIHVRDIIKQIYAFAILGGEKVKNPAEEVMPSSLATFQPRDRSLSPKEIRIMLKMLEHVPTLPTIRLGMKLLLLTMVRKSELVHAVWDEVDFENAVWTIPKARMKRDRPHNVYLSQQSLDILIALNTCSGNSRYLLPSRYEADAPMSRATFNRITYAVVELANRHGLPLEPFTDHDLRRTGSTLLNELGFNRDWIEKCLAHEDGHSSWGVYNKAKYEVQRRHMLQEWAELIDAWARGEKHLPSLFPEKATLCAIDPTI